MEDFYVVANHECAAHVKFYIVKCKVQTFIDNYFFYCLNCNVIFIRLNIKSNMLVQLDYFIAQFAERLANHKNVLDWFLAVRCKVFNTDSRNLVLQLTTTHAAEGALQHSFVQADCNENVRDTLDMVEQGLVFYQKTDCERDNSLSFAPVKLECQIRFSNSARHIPAHSLNLVQNSAFSNKVATWLFFETCSADLNLDYSVFVTWVKILYWLYQMQHKRPNKSSDRKRPNNVHSKVYSSTVRHVNSIFKKQHNLHVQICHSHPPSHANSWSFIIRNTKTSAYTIVSNNDQATNTRQTQNCCRCCQCKNLFRTKAINWPWKSGSNGDCDFQLELTIICLFRLSSSIAEEDDDNISYSKLQSLDRSTILPFIVELVFPNCPRTCHLLKCYFEQYFALRSAKFT